MDKGWNFKDEKSGQEAFDQPGDFGKFTEVGGDKKMHNVQVRDYGVKTIGLFNPGLNHF